MASVITPFLRLAPVLLALCATTVLARPGGPDTPMRTWTDADLRFGMTFPETFDFSADSGSLTAVAAETQKDLMEEVPSAGTGIVFSLSVYQPGDGFRGANPTLNLAETPLSRKEAKVPAKSYAEAGFSHFPKVMPGATQVKPIREVELAGKTWYTTDFELVANGMQVRARQWMTVGRKTKKLYTLSFIDEAVVFDRGLGFMQPVLDSVTAGW